MWDVLSQAVIFRAHVLLALAEMERIARVSFSIIILSCIYSLKEYATTHFATHHRYA